jgi:hypothetical protein
MLLYVPSNKQTNERRSIQISTPTIISLAKEDCLVPSITSRRLQPRWVLSSGGNHHLLVGICFRAVVHCYFGIGIFCCCRPLGEHSILSCRGTRPARRIYVERLLILCTNKSANKQTFFHRQRFEIILNHYYYGGRRMVIQRLEWES